MRIFSNFDTHAPLEAYQKALAEYGADKVMFFRRYKIYFVFFVVIPTIAIGLGIIGLSYLRSALFASFIPSNSFLGILLLSIIGIIVLLVIITIVLNYVNYVLDYTIVTPHLITSYNQKGLFKREIKTLDSDKIKAITSSGESLLQSLFNYGSILFLSEGDEEDQGDIRLHYLHNPNMLKDEVVRIIDMAKDL